MNKNFANIIIILGFAAVTAVLALQFAADARFNEAQRLVDSYRWRRAEIYFTAARKLAPFNTEYLEGYGELMIRKGVYGRDTIPYLERAEDLYEKALALNPRCAIYAVRLGEIRIEMCKHIVKIRGDKLMSAEDLVRKAFSAFRTAVENDPNGFNTAYSIAYAGVMVWEFLDDHERDLVLDRLRFSLEEDRGHGQYIYEHVWRSTGDFTILQDSTPETVRGYQNLYYFVESNNLWLYHRQVSGKLTVFVEEERPDEFSKRRQEKLLVIRKIKARYGEVGMLPARILPNDWEGATEGGAAYKDGAMFGTGTMHGAIETPEGSVALILEAKGTEAYDVWPYMVVELDGEPVGECFVKSAEWREYRFAIKSSGGIGVVSVTFTNDGGDWEKGIDRNLFIGEAWVEATGNER